MFARDRHTFVTIARCFGATGTATLLAMPRSRLNSETLAGENPVWEPLIAVLGELLVGRFMWMAKLRLEDGTSLHAYKHHWTRRYLHLDPEGNAYAYDGVGYHRTELREAIDDAFDDREDLEPDELHALDRALERAAA